MKSGAIDPAFWAGKRVFLTGHTGFKGTWLATWLLAMGAHLKGYSLPPDCGPHPSFFDSVGLASHLQHVEADVRDQARLERELVDYRPDIVFHLAAQSLVRDSYRIPVETFATNVMGTVHLLDAVRRCHTVRSVINVTSDKCYENSGRAAGYREEDPLGGYDPYSSSKAASEMAIASWRRSFFHPSKYSEHGVGIASVRAGNVLGGGDWSPDRLIPDAVRSFMSGRPASIRNPSAVRPWQFVLEPLSGYLLLAERLYAGADVARAWNFGPSSDDTVPVRAVVDQFVAEWGHGAAWIEASDPAAPHEAALLSLDCSRARQGLGWCPRTDLRQCLRLTAEWYRAYAGKASPVELLEITRGQIKWYSQL